MRRSLADRLPDHTGGPDSVSASTARVRMQYPTAIGVTSIQSEWIPSFARRRSGHAVPVEFRAWEAHAEAGRDRKGGWLRVWKGPQPGIITRIARADCIDVL